MCKLVEKVSQWHHLTRFLIGKKDKRIEKEKEGKRYTKIQVLIAKCDKRQ